MCIEHFPTAFATISLNYPTYIYIYIFSSQIEAIVYLFCHVLSVFPFAQHWDQNKQILIHFLLLRVKNVLKNALILIVERRMSKEHVMDW